MTSQPFPVACFAPPLSDELLNTYQELTRGISGPVADAMLTCLIPVRLWWKLPESKCPGQTLKIFHRTDPNVERVETPIKVTPLEEQHKKDLWDSIPWGYEIDAIQKLFDTISPATNNALRNAAFHLLWYVRELNADREPLTQEALA